MLKSSKLNRNEIKALEKYIDSVLQRLFKMRTIYKSKDIELSVQFDDRNNHDTIYGNLKLTLANEVISSEATENLGYFYVDCDRFLKTIVESNFIQNELFELSDSQLLLHYRCWLEHNIEEEENQIVHFFDSNYFLTGSKFTSYFFDDIMLMYQLQKSVCHFMYWRKLNPVKVFTVSVPVESVMSAFKEFMKVFDDYVQTNTDRWKMENENQ